MNIIQEDHLFALPEDLIEKAKNMSKAYEYIYCIENLMRLYLGKFSNLNFPNGAIKSAEVRKQDELKHRWLSLRGGSDLFYMDFKDLSGLITGNWEFFKDDFPSQSWIISKLEDLSRYRNLIAHNSYLDQTDLDGIRFHFNSISRQLSVKSRGIENTINEDDLFVKGLNNSKKYSLQDIYSGIQHKLFFPREIDIVPIELITFFEQISLRFRLVYDWTNIDLWPDLLGEDESDIDTKYELSQYMYFQIGQFDIDGDGIEELFICFQDNNPNESENQIKINVFKYYPPAYKKHAYRPENWEKIGTFEYGFVIGEPIAYVKDNSVYIPRNYREYFAEWVWVQFEFIEKGI